MSKPPRRDEDGGLLISAIMGELARAYHAHPHTRVCLIVNGIAHPVDDVWWEPGQYNGAGAICVGDDPR